MLPTIALLLGVAISLQHLIALLATESTKAFVQRFSRSSFFGWLLFSIALIWTLTLALTTDLGEFSSLRNSIVIGIVVGGGLFGWLVPHFLAVRSLGFLGLLAAHPLLELTHFQSGALPLLLSLLAYLWIVIALFSIGMPYLFRNFVNFITDSKRAMLYRWFSWIGLLYGLILILLGAIGVI
jgi:hypothetical protein